MREVPKYIVDRAVSSNEGRCYGFSDEDLAELIWESVLEERDLCARIALEWAYEKESINEEMRMEFIKIAIAIRRR